MKDESIPLFSANQIPIKLIEQNWKKSFDILFSKGREYMFHFMCRLGVALTWENSHEFLKQMNISPDDFLLLLWEHPNPELKKILYIFMEKYPEKSLFFADLKSNISKLVNDPNSILLIDCCCSIYASLKPEKLIDFTKKFQQYAQTHLLDEPIKKRLEFYELLTKVIDCEEVNLKENIENLLKTNLFPEIYNLLSLHRKWNNFKQAIALDAIIYQLNIKEQNVEDAYNYLCILARIDSRIALKQLEKIEKENFPNGLEDNAFMENGNPLNVFSGCFAIALMFKISPPLTNPQGFIDIAETLMNSPTLPMIISLDNDNYKDELLLFFIWYDQQKLTKTSFSDQFLKKIEAEAATRKDHTLYLWLANTQKFLRKKENT